MMKVTDFQIVHREDYEFTWSLLSGASDAWDRFYNEFRKKIAALINRKYPNVFSGIAVEEIFDGVCKRLIENDFRALREYRGECSFSSYITRAAEWEIKDWLRRHSEELLHDPIDTIGGDGKEIEDYSSLPDAAIDAEKNELPYAVKALNDDLRFAFLLRYYDYFGFPLDEIRLLAKKKGIPIGIVTQRIVRFLDPEGKDILRVQREKQKALQERLQKVCYGIHNLDIKEHRLTDDENHEDTRSEKIQELRSRRSKLERKRDALLKDKARFIITTPYEVVAEILAEDNVSTIRSRVFLAKKQLAEVVTKKGKTFHESISS